MISLVSALGFRIFPHVSFGFRLITRSPQHWLIDALASGRFTIRPSNDPGRTIDYLPTAIGRPCDMIISYSCPSSIRPATTDVSFTNRLICEVNLNYGSERLGSSIVIKWWS
jgi:hypothetical protein